MTTETELASIRCRVAACDESTSDVRILRLAPVSGALFDWRAGQYANLTVDGMPPRDFSIANGPGEEMLEFHIRRAGSGGLSDVLCDDAGSAGEIEVRGPFGAAYWRDRHPGPILAIAGGTGLAPMKAICEAALKAGHKQDVHLYFGVRTETDLYLERHFIKMQRTYPNFRFISVVSEPTEESGRRRGLVGDAVAADFQLLYGHQCYIGGPPAMADACRAMLKLKGVPPHDLFCDLFYPSA